MRFTRRQLLACCLTLGVVGLVATADPQLTNTAGVVMKPVYPTAADSTPTPCMLVPLTDLPCSLPIPLQSPKPVSTFAIPVEQNALPLTPVVLPLPTPEPPLAVTLPKIEVPQPAVVPELPKLEVAKVSLPMIDLPTLVAPNPVAAPETPRVVQVEAITPASFHRLVIDFNAKPIKFEVTSGTMILKVECDAMDVRMPGEQGTTATPLKATGHVKFTAPGCSGSCDELAISTASGEAILHGNVKLRCRQGAVETEVTGTSVKFKLGAATTPIAPIAPTSALLPAPR